MIDRKKCMKGVAPPGIAVYPKLNTPDFKYKKEFGEWVVKVNYKVEDVTDLIASIDAFHAKAYELESRPGKTVSPKVARESHGHFEEGDPFFGNDTKPYHDLLDKEGNVVEGMVQMKFSSLAGGKKEEKNPDTGEMEARVWTRGVIVLDSRGKPTKAKVGGGSLLLLSFGSRVWCNAAIGFGMSLTIEGVQIKELVTRGAKSADELGFGEIEGGFVADDEEEGEWEDTPNPGGGTEGGGDEADSSEAPPEF